MIKLIVLLTLLLLSLTADYCQTIDTSARIFLAQNQLRTIPLTSLIQGYNLKYTVDVPTIAKVYSSYQITSERPMNLGQYTNLRSVDVSKNNNLAGMGIAGILATKQNNQDLAIWVGEFQGYSQLPAIDKFRYFTLPDKLIANCFDLRVINEDLQAVLNCQTVPKTGETQQDLFCYIKPNETALSLSKNCKTIITLASSLSRQTKLFKIGEKTFLFSVNRDLVSGTFLSYISVYYVNSKKEVIFNNIIDGSSLQNPSLQISDLVITKDNTIVLSDSSLNRLVLLDYSPLGEILVKKIKYLSEKPLSLAYDANKNTLLVATRNGVIEYNSKSDTAIAKYQVDTSDPIIVTLKVSDNLVAFQTKNKNLYIYQRNQYKINYLLTKQVINSDTHFVLAEQTKYLFTFNTKTSQSVSVQQPYLQISKITKNQELQVTAQSQSQSCQVQLLIGSVKDPQQVFIKQELSEKSFKVDRINGLNLKLDKYYAGVNLQYEYSKDQQNQDFNIQLKHIQKYPFKASFAATEASAILAINEVSYYYIGLNTIKESMIYVDVCSLSQNGIQCKAINKAITFQKKQPVEFLIAKTRSDGTSFVGWSHKNCQYAQWINIKNKNLTSLSGGTNFSYSSMIIADQTIILLSKTSRSISIVFQTYPIVNINQQMFTNDQLTELQFFYPRQIYLDNVDQNILFVKLPSKIAKFAILPTKNVKYIGIVKVLKEYTPANLWSISTNSQSTITMLQGSIIEEYYNPTQSKYVTLQSIESLTAPTPLVYDRYSNLIASISEPDKDGTRIAKFMKANQGSVGLQYAQIKIIGRPSFSGNWLLVDGANPIVHFISSSPTLTIQTNIPDQIFKEDQSLSISVKSKTVTKKSKTQIEAVNYPVNVQDMSNVNVIKMPVTADKVELELPVQSYFNGSVADYKLYCPACDGEQIKLLPPLRQNRRFKGISASDFVAVAENVAVLSSNTLILFNSNIQQLTRIHITEPVSCSNIQYNVLTGLLVFCSQQNGQSILSYNIKDNTIEYKSKYFLQGSNAIRHFDQMFVYSNKQGVFVMILDNDEKINSNNKRSTIKVFQVNNTLVYKTEWTSKSFALLDVYPINDFTMIGAQILVTLGNYGIGYATFTEKAVLINPNNLKLTAEPSLKNILVDDSFFKQISVISYNHDISQLQVFITSTTSLNMVILLTLTDVFYRFKALTETYYRYGAQQLLNWHAVTAKNIFLSFYNNTVQKVTIVSYNRNKNQRNQFTIGVPVKLSKNLIQYHQAFITKNSQLLVSQISDLSQYDQLICLDITGTFSLMLNYDKPGNFNSISIQATNSYTQALHNQKVEFEKPIPPPPPPPPPVPDNDTGLKWYIIVIIIAASLILIGTAYGLYRYTKNKRDEKSVSLLTEREEEEEQERRRPMKETLVKDTEVGYTTVGDRSSINLE